MKYTVLGKSGLQVSAVGLGCMSVGTKGWLNWDWLLDRDQSEAYFRKAVEVGINFFDTADSYSDGASEEILGHWLKKYAILDEIVLATKVFFGSADRPNMYGLSRKHIIQSCEASLKRLGVESIDLYQIHRYDPVFPIEEMLLALDTLITQGKVKYIGACSMYAWEFMKMLSVADQLGSSRFVSMQNLYNLLYREEEREMLALCESEGIGVIPWSPLARGLLARSSERSEASRSLRSQTDPFLDSFHTPADQEIISRVHSLAKKYEVKESQVSLAWLRSKKVVSAPIIGFSKLSHIEDAVASTEFSLSDEDVAYLEEPYQPRSSFGITPPFTYLRPGKIHDRRS